MVSIFKDTIKSPLKEFEYTQSKIRSDKDELKKGGHVTLNFRDKILGFYWLSVVLLFTASQRVKGYFITIRI
jgi:hypothetical protein